jgi:pimeloyl-ACP methyl ester carboxylesterase
VVLIGGSGPSDRHNGGLFDALRAHLASAGVAVLAYDKRGAGRSTGTWAAATVEDLAHDAAGAVTVLQAHPRVAADAVGVLGHSEGGWVALRLCARLGTPRHLIVNSCPAVSFAESEVYALTTAGAQHGAAALLEQLTAAARAGRSYQQGQQIIAACQHEPWYPLLSAEGFTLDPATWAQLTAWADYDPCDDLTRLKTPTLAIFGENDSLGPVRASIDRYQQTAASAGRYQQSIVFPGAGHRLQVTAGGFAPGYLAQLSTWCHDQTGARSLQLDRRPGGLDHLIEEYGQLAALRQGQAGRQVAADGVPVDRPGAPQGVPARGGEDGEAGPAVGLVRLALGQPGGGELVHDPAHPGPAEHHPLAELAHPQPPLGRGVQLEQHVVPGQSDLPGRPQVRLDRGHQPAVRHQQAAPRVNRGILPAGGYASGPACLSVACGLDPACRAVACGLFRHELHPTICVRA